METAIWLVEKLISMVIKWSLMLKVLKFVEAAKALSDRQTAWLGVGWRGLAPGKGSFMNGDWSLKTSFQPKFLFLCVIFEFSRVIQK